MIATLPARPATPGIPVMIVSGDRDVYQLVRDGVRVMTTSRGVTDTKIYDREGWSSAMACRRSSSPTSSASRATPPDNIPGVPGIGDKTAAQLLQQFGSSRRCSARSTRSRARSASRT